MINLKIKTGGTERSLSLPIARQSVPDIIEKDSIVTILEITDLESLKYMEGNEWNINEINFLAKRMESFDQREQRQFDAAVSKLKPITGQDLINFTFNLPRYSLIYDFSSPTEIGKTHIMNRKQAMSFDEMASTDFAKIGKDLMDSGKGIPTSYGVLFVNEDIPFEAVYDGKHFPAYDYKDSLATVAVSYKNETEYLYLPCPIEDISDALARLPASGWNDCEYTIESANFPQGAWRDTANAILENEGIYCLNSVCQAVKTFCRDDYEKLSAVMEMTSAEDSASIVAIANQLRDFIYIPDAEDSAKVGLYWVDNICGYEYDEALEDYIDFGDFGDEVVNHCDCAFLDSGGFVAVNENVSLDRLLDAAQKNGKTRENNIQPKSAPDNQNLIAGRFFFPLTYTLIPLNEYGDLDWSDSYEDAGSEYAEGYLADIQETFDKYTAHDDCNMIEYFDDNKSAREKIVSAKWGFAEIDGQYYGVVDALMKEPLNDEEENDFKDWICGQNADGLGDGFEQQEIRTNDGVLNVHFWNSGDNYFVENEEEFNARHEFGIGGIG